MFIGSINRYMRTALETATLRPGSGQARAWKGLPVYVACSGNFTFERILAHLTRAASVWDADPPGQKTWLTATAALCTKIKL